MSADVILVVRMGPRSYVVRREQVHELRRMPGGPGGETVDARGKPMVNVALGPLLDPDGPQNGANNHAILVQLRRRSVAFMVDFIDRLDAPEPDEVGTPGGTAILPLPPLLKRRLARPWFAGVLIGAAGLLLVLDLRQIAQDVVLGQASQEPRQPEQP